MMRSLLGTPILLLALVGCGNPPGTDPIFVGHLAPLSGPDKLIGEHARRGILLAVEEVNQEDNRIQGRRVNVLHADTRGETDQAKNEAVRLITINKVTALLGGTDT